MKNFLTRLSANWPARLAIGLGVYLVFFGFLVLTTGTLAIALSLEAVGILATALVIGAVRIYEGYGIAEVRDPSRRQRS